jgi:hypothetical protein
MRCALDSASFSEREGSTLELLLPAHAGADGCPWWLEGGDSRTQQISPESDAVYVHHTARFIATVLRLTTTKD